MDQIGTRGKYQIVIIILSCLVFLEMGIFLLSMPYTFALPSYSNCPAPHSGAAACEKYVCSLPPQNRFQYENPQTAQLKNLANAFGNYECHYSYLISAAMGVPWFGALIGNMIITMFADNFGRRKAYIISEVLVVLGYTILLVAQNLVTA